MVDSSPAMAVPRTRAVARRAAARGWRRDAIAAVGRGLGAGAIAALVLVMVVKVVPIDVPWWSAALAALGVGAGLGCVWALRSRWTAWRGASELDRSLGLRDRLTSALSLSGVGGADDAVLALVAAEGERAAAEASPRRAIAVPFGRAWAVALAGAAAAGGVGVFVPPRADPGEAVAALAIEAERERVARDVSAAIEAIEETIKDEDSTGEATADELAALEELERALREGRVEPEDAAAASAAALDRAAEELERRGDLDEIADRSLRDQLADAASRDGNSPSEADGAFEALREAFESGDLERARDAARELLDDADRLPAEQRERLAERLDELARSIEPSDAERGAGDAASDPPTGASSERAPEQPDAGEGAPPDRPPSIDERAQELGEQGAEPASAREQAEREQRDRDAREAEERARDDRQRLADGARESAERLREPGQSPRGEEPRREPGDAGEPPRESGAPQEQPGSGEPGRSPSETPARGAEQGQDTEQRPGNERPSRSSGSEREPGDSQGGPERGGEQTPDGQREPGGTQRQTDQPGSDGRPAPTRPGERTEPGGESREQGEPGSGAPTQPPQSTQPAERPGAPDGPRRGESLDEALEDLAQRDDRAEQQRDRARELRECANESLGDQSGEGPGAEPGDQPRPSMVPDDARREPGPGRTDAARPPSGDAGAGRGDDATDRSGGGTAPGETEPADFRRGDGDGGGRIVSDWFDPESPRPTAPGRSDAARRMREAADGARRAIEQQQVPRKYRDLIRRVYERMEQRSAEFSEDVPLGENADMPSDDG